MQRQTIIIITNPEVEAYGNFKKLCEAKGWVYQTLSNKGTIPKIGKPVEIDGFKIYRVKFN